MASAKGLMIAPSADRSGRTNSRRGAIGNMTRWTMHSRGPTKFRGEVAVDGLLKVEIERLKSHSTNKRKKHINRERFVAQGNACAHAFCNIGRRSGSTWHGGGGCG